MESNEKKRDSARPVSFVKGILGAVFGGASKEDIALQQLKETKEKIEDLKVYKKDLEWKLALATKRFDKPDSIEIELKKIDKSIKDAAEGVLRREGRVKECYANRDIRVKELEAAKESLKKVLAEKRSIREDVSLLDKKEKEIEGLRTKLEQARLDESEIAKAFEEIEMRLKFANANMETLVLDLTTVKNALGDLEKDITAKKESIESEKNVHSAINEALVKLGELIDTKARLNADYHTATLKNNLNNLKKIREDIKNAEEERSSIPKKIADLNVKGGFGGNREKKELIMREKGLAEEIKRLQADENRISQEAENNRLIVEKAQKLSLELQRVMIGAGLDDYVSKVGGDETSLNILKRDIEKKGHDLADSISARKKDLALLQDTQSQKQVTITKMTTELDKLIQDAERDKREVGANRDRLKKIKDQSVSLRANLEARFKEKSTGLSDAMNVTLERKRIDALETEGIGLVKRIEAEISSLDQTAEGMLSALKQEKGHIEELKDMKQFLNDRLKDIKDLERLRSIERELDLAKEVASKYEADLKILEGLKREKSLLKEKMALLEETAVPITVIESRLSEMLAEKERLENEVTPLRSELNFAFEKRDNIEMEISFAEEALKKTKKRRESLEGKFEFVTSESGSVKNIQDKLAACEKELISAERNTNEIQTRLNFATANEDVIKEKLQGSQDSIKNTDKDIDNLNRQITEKDTLLSELRTKMAGYESALNSEKISSIELETNQSILKTELKKIALERGALEEKVKDLEASLAEYEERRTAAKGVEDLYHNNLEKQKKLDTEIAGHKEEVNEIQTKLDDVRGQVSDLEAKKRELMERSLAPSEIPKEVQKGKEEISALREKRKAVREEIKEIEVKIEKVKASSDKQGADKDKAYAAMDSLRDRRKALHDQVKEINEKIAAVKEGGGEEGVMENDSAKDMAKAIGELDIKALVITKNIKKLDAELEPKKEKLQNLVDERNGLELEIEKQKKNISSLNQIIERIESIKKERDSVKDSLKDKREQNDRIAKKLENAEKSAKNILKNVEDAKEGFGQAKKRVEVMEAEIAGFRSKLDDAVKNRSLAGAEHSKLKNEMDSIINSTSGDHETLDREHSITEKARIEIEDNKKKLDEVMVILTGKAGSVDGLKLEIASSIEEEKDISERIRHQETELKSVMAAIEGIESDIMPKIERLKILEWTKKVMDEKLQNLKIRTEFKQVTKRLEELEEARGLFDEFNDLSKAKEDLRVKVGELKNYLELEAQAAVSEQAKYKAGIQAKEFIKKLESKDILIKDLEIKYKSSYEDRAHMKGMLDEIKRQFESAKARWGNIEELSRVKDKLEMETRELKDKFGAMEMMGAKIERMERENNELRQRTMEIEEKCHRLGADKKSLESSLARTQADFRNVFEMLKRSRDEAVKFLYSE